MIAPPTNPKAETERTDRHGEPFPLSQRYGSIGIQAVAAAARYADRRKSQPQSQGSAVRIDQRFVESAV
jgi:hypothetical protein